ncbi:MAG TPA: T9SS type A sorting domain-containing protein, partial [Rhodothermales bacterium]|nr:T9SS type A sorting domain-containing protein [Rhodothermales bacterium]
ISMPGAYNLVVTPDGNPDESEVFRLELTSAGEAYMVVIGPELAAGKLEGIAVYAIDSQGNVVQPAVVTSTETGGEQPIVFALHGNYPNPFNPATTIRYDVPEPVDVHIKVHDALGRTLTSLSTGHRAPGAYSVTWDGRDMPSGVYFVRMEAGSFVETRKMVLLK